MIFGLLLYLFFFKQKTAYEMRISDWSSDVCSSDLRGRPSPHKHIRLTQLRDDLFRRKTLTSHNFLQFFRHNRLSLELDQFFQGRPNHADMDIIGPVPFYQLPPSGQIGRATSELQSLMRISYAVFCLKKKHKYILYYTPNYINTHQT